MALSLFAEFWRGAIEIGYHAILQDSNRSKDGPELERLLEVERANVASMEVKQALKTAELMRKLMKEAVVGAE